MGQGFGLLCRGRASGTKNPEFAGRESQWEEFCEAKTIKDLTFAISGAKFLETGDVFVSYESLVRTIS